MKKIILIAGAALICSCVIGCASAPAKPETAAQVSGTGQTHVKTLSDKITESVKF